MADEIRLAFAHPNERAIATADESPRDRISLRDHIVTAEIGAFQAERGTTQRLRFNVVVEVLPFSAPLEDDVDRILSYDRVTEAIAFELAAERLNLLETLAERVAERILLEPQALRTFVRVEKLDRGPGALGVEILRTRQNYGAHLNELAEESAKSRPSPRVVYLGNPVLDDPRLTACLDALEASSDPVILCLGQPETELPSSDHPMTQRRIELLAIEQNAWCLAARDPRCKVVATRTELDWAMKNAQISIWAPSKIVLDATQGPGTATRDPLALAAWFAGEMEAQALVVLGAEPAAESPVPQRSADLDHPLF